MKKAAKRDLTEEGLQNAVIFSQILCMCEEETVTEEQVQRVLAPVLALIQAGVFDRPRWKRVLSGRNASSIAQVGRRKRSRELQGVYVARFRLP